MCGYECSPNCDALSCPAHNVDETAMNNNNAVEYHILFGSSVVSCLFAYPSKVDELCCTNMKNECTLSFLDAY